MLDARDIYDRTQGQITRYMERDARWDNVRNARRGDLSLVAPDMFSDDIPRPIVANFIDIVARNLAEMLAPLPAFQCSSATMQSDTARKFADKRTKILQNYIRHSKLDKQMFEAADHYNTYGAMVFYLEPDFEAQLPRVTAEDPSGGYADFDRWGNLKCYYKRYAMDAYVLALMYPEVADKLYESAQDPLKPGTRLVELIRYCDRDQVALVLNAKEPTMIVSMKNRLGETPVVVVRRSWLHTDHYKGQFDDAVWVQVARNALATLNLEAVEKSVQAPLAVPSDVQEFPVGPDSIIRTNTPEKVKKVGLELPVGAFQESALMMEELRTGTRYPAARSGDVDASIITGRGVQALLGGFESQVTAGQVVFKDGFRDIARMLFKMDELYWPNVERNIQGSVNGTPYEIKYRASKDIAGDHSADVEYGFAAGMDPNRAVVMLLQLRGDKLVSRDFFQRQLPFDINVSEEASKIDVEDTREALKQGVYGYIQAIAALVQQGMDATQPILQVAMLIEGLQKGEAIEKVVQKVFAPTPPPTPPGAPPGAEAGMMAGQMPGEGGPGGMGPGGGLTESGRMTGVAAGQAGQAPGGRPDLSVMLAGLTGQGQPQMSQYVMKRRRI